MSDDNESRPDLRHTKDLIQMRRAETLRLLSQGLNGYEISARIGVSRSLTCLDIQFLKEQAQESLKSHIQKTIPFEYQKSKQAINDLIFKANEILQNTDDDKMKLQTIGVLANLHAANMNLNSDGTIIQQAYDKLTTLEEIQKRRSRSDNEEAVFSEEDLTKEDTNPEAAKITTIDDQDMAPEPDENIQEEDGKE